MNFKNHSIRIKLVVLLGFSAAMAILITSLIMGPYTAYTKKEESLKALEQLSLISSENLRAAVAFMDQQSADKMLSHLSKDKTIVCALIFDQNNAIFSSYFADSLSKNDILMLKNRTEGMNFGVMNSGHVRPPDATKHERTRTADRELFHINIVKKRKVIKDYDFNFLHVSVPITLADDVLASLHIVSSTASLKSMMIRLLITQTFVAMVTILLLVIVSFRLQNIFTKPIYSLLETMKKITEQKNYSVSAQTSSNDEFKDLYSGFNIMLSEIRYRDNKLESYSKDLEKTVQERTAELLDTVEALEISNRAKSEFLAVMSHELRTPMNGILGMAELLSASELTQEQRHYINTIRNSGSSLVFIINEILDYTKIEAGRMEVSLQPVNVNKLMQNVWYLLQTQATRKGLSFDFKGVSEADGNVATDEVKLKQIIVNLVGNAIKFTQEGGVEFSVKTVCSDKDKVILRFEVNDDGIGIPKEKQEKIFEMFSQADSTTTRRFGGTGIGLSISSKMTELLGGRLQVQSEEGEGSCFFFELEMERTAGDQVKNQIVMQNSGETPVFAGKVLIVDDEPVNLEVGNDMLALLGLEPDKAENGADALEMIKNNTYEMVFMDIQMPVMDGMMCTEKVREMKGYEGLPIIAMTANAVAGDRERFLGAGMSDYISKPYTLEALAKTISQWQKPASFSIKETAVIKSSSFKYIDSVVFNTLSGRYGERNREKFISILRLFMESSKKQATLLEELLAKDDVPQIGKVTHAMKSSSGNIGALALSQKCEYVEKSIKAGKEIDISASVNFIIEMVAKVHAELQTFIECQHSEGGKECVMPSDSGSKSIVIIDDDQVSLEMMADAIELMDYMVTPFLKAMDAVEYLKMNMIDLIMVDAEMPVINGFEAIKMIRNLKGYGTTPVIMVTGCDDYDAIENAFRAGATGFEIKPVNWAVYSHRLNYIFKASEAFEQANTLATTDVLTGLANRRFAMTRLDEAVVMAARKREYLGIIMLDIDHFKSVNDRFGHPVGDIVLKSVATVLAGAAREYDLVGRVGGEEFLVICDSADTEIITSIAERMRKSVEETVIDYGDGHTTQVTISLGVVSKIPCDDGSDSMSMIRYADEALYKAKNNGRNRVEL